MCAIAGFTGQQREELLRQLSSQLSHRGPDGEGFYTNKKVSLLNRRLAIIDRQGGDQPIFNEDKSLVVVYNGEIYNYRELTGQLKKLGHKFTTKSDTEVMVHGYEEWGIDLFNKLNGMFALALYNLKTETLLLARDHFGIKPLYYSFFSDDQKQQIIFASEIKPILNSRLVKKETNDRVIYRYLRYRLHDDGEGTFFKGIYRLLPGQLMTIKNSRVEKKIYSQLPKELEKSENIQMTDKKTALFKEKLIEAIKLRLISEVPVGTCLSGGLDSSTVAAVINKLLMQKTQEASSVGAKQNTFSAVFPGMINDEEKYVDKVLSQKSKVKSHKVYPKPEKFFEEIGDFIKTQEEPTISTGPYAQYKVMQEAKKIVTVLLDGQGVDEMMAGYLPYYLVYFKQLAINKNFLRLFWEIFCSLDILWTMGWKKLSNRIGLKTEVPVLSLLNNDFQKRFVSEQFIVESDNLKKRLVQDIFQNSLPALLRYEDKNSMRFSMEGRVPFLDVNFLKLIFSLEDKVIIKDGWNKYILRKSLSGFLPETIINRRNKVGFTTPEQEWFLRMKNRIYSYFLSESFAERAYFNQSAVLKAFREFIEGKNDDTMIFWRLLNVELWLREFFDEKVERKEVKEKGMFKPNQGKTIKIKVEDKEYWRYPVKTDLFQKGDKIEEKITKHVKEFTGKLASHDTTLHQKGWMIIISEKVVAISQGRSFFIWDIKPGFWAQTLSRFVTRTPYGIGLGSPWTMQLAISEVGLVRILLASVASVICKPLGVKGIFYQIAGREAASIDGPTEYSLYPSNVSAKLGPKEPQKVAMVIDREIKKILTNHNLRRFQGVVIVDANDIGRNVLGNTTELKNQQIEEIMRDNPMGQASQQTPIIICFSGK